MTGEPVAWSPVLPQAAQEWLSPQYEWPAVAHWYGTADEYRNFFGMVLEQEGEEALAIIYRHVPKRDYGRSGRPTRWFCPAVPMRDTGQRTVQAGRPIAFYEVPARAALDALHQGLVMCAHD